MQSCNLDFTSSKKNAKNRLIKVGAIDIYDRITDMEKFKAMAESFRKHASTTYGITSTAMVWAVEGLAAYNEKAFRQIDSIKASMPKKEQVKEPQIKPGVSELFESNPELANAVYSKLLTNSGISAENLLSLLIKEKIVEKQC